MTVDEAVKMVVELRWPSERERVLATEVIRMQAVVADQALAVERRSNHHEIVKLAFEARLRPDATPMTNREIALWCHSMADAVYPPTTPASVPAVTYLSEAALAAIAAASSAVGP